jgi:hypothetical protein
MKSTKTPLWFKRRRYGYGWIPVTIQGWIVVFVYLVVVVGGAAAFLDAPETTSDRESAFFLLFATIATMGLLSLTRYKGPKPRWRWGKKPTDNPAEDF